jgi:hypothetical protein
MSDWRNSQKCITVASLLSATRSGRDQPRISILPQAAPVTLRLDGIYGLMGNVAGEQDIAYG